MMMMVTTKDTMEMAIFSIWASKNKTKIKEKKKIDIIIIIIIVMVERIE